MFDKLKKEFDENPTLTLAVLAAATTAVAKLIDAMSGVQGRRAYAQQVKYRTKNK